MKNLLMLIIFISNLCNSQPLIPVTIIETRPEVLCAGDSIQVRFVVLAPITPTQAFQAAIRLDKSGSTIIDTLYNGTLSSLTVVDTLSIGLVYGKTLKVPNQFPSGTWFASGNISSPNQVSIVVNGCHISPIIISYGPDSICPYDSICVRIYNPDNEAFYFNWQSTSISPPAVLTWIEIFVDPDEQDTVNYCFKMELNPLEDFGCGPGFIGINLENQFPIFIKCDCWVGIEEYLLNECKPIYFTLYEPNVPVKQIPNTVLIEQRGISRHKILIFE